MKQILLDYSPWLLTVAIPWLAISVRNFFTLHPEYLETEGEKKLFARFVSVVSFLSSRGVKGFVKMPGKREVKPLEGKKPKGEEGSIRLGAVVAVCAFAALACGTTLLQKVDTTGKAIDRGWERTFPSWSSECKAEALKCRKEGVKLELKDCPRADKCFKSLDAYRLALDEADNLIQIGAPLAAAEDPKASDFVTAGIVAFGKAMKSMTDWKAWKAAWKGEAVTK